MPEQASTTTPAGRPAGRRALVIAAGALAAVALVVVVLQLTGADGAAPAATSSPSQSEATAPVDPTPSPSAPGPSSTASPSVSPSAPVTGPDGRPTLPPVDLEDPASPADDVEVRLTSIEAVEGEAQLPGEVGGPALRVTVEVTNGGTTELDLRGAVVNLYYGPDLTPSVGLLEPGARALPDSAAAGSAATGVWVFNVPVEDRDLVTVEFDLATSASVVLFAGSAPR